MTLPPMIGMDRDPVDEGAGGPLGADQDADRVGAREGDRAAAAPEELSLIYRALADGQVDVIAGDATGGLIEALDLAPLGDPRQYFPPYDAIPVVPTATLLRGPAIDRALSRLAGRVSDAEMRALNAAVDLDRRDVRDVVRAFLARLN